MITTLPALVPVQVTAVGPFPLHEVSGQEFPVIFFSFYLAVILRNPHEQNSSVMLTCHNKD
jgi:hypothetical protein